MGGGGGGGGGVGSIISFGRSFGWSRGALNVCWTHCRSSRAERARFSLGPRQSRGKDFLVNIYKSYIRPKLEYASTVWSPTDKASNILLENIQRRFTKRIKCLSTLNYEQRLSSLDLSSLSARRQYNDVMLLYKCLHEFSNIQLTDLKISVCKLSSRGAGFRLKHYKPRSTLLASGFYCRAVKLWNSLPITVAKSNSIGAFKKATIKHFNS